MLMVSDYETIALGRRRTANVVLLRISIGDFLEIVVSKPIEVVQI